MLWQDAAQALLAPGESNIPEPVAQTARFLAEHEIWFKLSRNREARSCRDAARKRYRLGHVGIPLWDEMKSFFASVRTDGRGPGRTYVLAHCRGDRELMLDALRSAVGGIERPQRLTHDELAALGLHYGVVNPFERWKAFELDGRLIHAPVLQVFDDDLLTALGTPGTVMTNAGDLTWAVEFHAQQLFTKLSAVEGAPRPIAAAIAAEPPGGERRPPSLSGRRAIAIITGNAPEAGIALWQTINRTARDLLGSDNTGDASMPAVRVLSLPELGMTMELADRADDVWARLEAELLALLATDVSLLAIACNTTQFFADKVRAICEPAGVDFVSLPEVVAAWLTAHRVREIALVGIPYVAQFGKGWSGYEATFRDFAIEQLDSRTLERLVTLAYRVKEEGPTHSALQAMRVILRDGVRSPHVVLALTELSGLLALQRQKGTSGKTIVDPITLYGEALVRRWLGRPFPVPPSDWSIQMTAFSHQGNRVGRENEDAVLLNSTLLSRSRQECAAAPPVHQELQQLDSRGSRKRSIVAAVADGVGSHAAAAQTSQLVLERLRDASDRLQDPDDLEAFFDATARALAHEADRHNDPPGARRGTTTAGVVLSLSPKGDSDLHLVWFSVGDCLLLVLAGERRDTSWNEPKLLCHPAVSPDGHPQRALGANAVPEVDSGVLHVADEVLVLCMTDGFVESFGIASASATLSDELSTDTRLAPLWKRLAESDGSPDDDRAVVAQLFAAAQAAWPLADTGRAVDNLSVALIRARRTGDRERDVQPQTLTGVS